MNVNFIPSTWRVVLLTVLLSLPSVGHANSVACFNTNAGDFCIELFETQTPISTANFLNYINNGAYTDSIFHRSVPGFVIQGGGFKLVSSETGGVLERVDKLAPIKNEFKISNARGTVAMAKIGGDPDSATSEWFVNLSDNSANLDNQNGGFTVFGRVIFDGMNVIDSIADLQIVGLDSVITALPIVSSDNNQVVPVKTNNITVTESSGIFSENNLSFTVDIGTGDYFAVNLRLIENSPNIVFELDADSITQLPTTPANFAIFSLQTGTLTIPSVMVDNATVVNNVLMELTNASALQFTLLSLE